MVQVPEQMCLCLEDFRPDNKSGKNSYNAQSRGKNED